MHDGSLPTLRAVIEHYDEIVPPPGVDVNPIDTVQLNEHLEPASRRRARTKRAERPEPTAR